MTQEKCSILRFNALYVLGVMRCPHTAQLRPSADSEVKASGGECAT